MCCVILQARVDRIHINGLARTKNDIVEDAVQDLFSASDFEEVLLKAQKVDRYFKSCKMLMQIYFEFQVRTKLDSLGCFRNIAVFIDTSKGPDATTDGLEV